MNRFIDDHGTKARIFNLIILMVVVIKLVVFIFAIANRLLTLTQMVAYS